MTGRRHFTESELAYLQSERRLGRLATADTAGRPQVTPVGMWMLNHELGTIDVTGHDIATTRKYRNVRANPHAALVIDDIASLDPWRPRAVVIEGAAKTVDEGGSALIRIVPTKILSWGLDSPEG